MQRGIAENSIKFRPKGQVLTIHDLCIQTFFLSFPDLVGTGIDGFDITTQGDELLRQGPITTAQVQYPLPRLGGQQVNDGHPKLCHKAGILAITVGIPGLGNSGHGQSFGLLIGDQENGAAQQVFDGHNVLGIQNFFPIGQQGIIPPRGQFHKLPPQ